MKHSDTDAFSEPASGPEGPAGASPTPTPPEAGSPAPTPRRARTTLPSVDPLLVDAVTAARLLGISRTTLDGCVRDGEIPVVRLRGRVLFNVEKLRAIASGEGGRP